MRTYMPQNKSCFRIFCCIHSFFSRLLGWREFFVIFLPPWHTRLRRSLLMVMVEVALFSPQDSVHSLLSSAHQNNLLMSLATVSFSPFSLPLLLPLSPPAPTRLRIPFLIQFGPMAVAASFQIERGRRKPSFPRHLPILFFLHHGRLMSLLNESAKMKRRRRPLTQMDLQRGFITTWEKKNL